MYMEHDLYENTDQEGNGLLYLVDEEGFKHPVYKDQYGRNHMLLYKNICYLPILGSLYAAGLRNIRLETAHLSLEELKEVLTYYQKAINNLKDCEILYEEYSKKHLGSTLGAYAI